MNQHKMLEGMVEENCLSFGIYALWLKNYDTRQSEYILIMPGIKRPQRLTYLRKEPANQSAWRTNQDQGWLGRIFCLSLKALSEWIWRFGECHNNRTTNLGTRKCHLLERQKKILQWCFKMLKWTKETVRFLTLGWWNYFYCFFMESSHCFNKE